MSRAGYISGENNLFYSVKKGRFSSKKRFTIDNGDKKKKP